MSPPGQRKGPAANEAPQDRWNATTTEASLATATRTSEDVAREAERERRQRLAADHADCIPLAALAVALEELPVMGRRVVQQAITEAVPAYWRRRAETFAAVGTPACDEIATACRNAAALAQSRDPHCCSAMSLAEIAEAGRRELWCGSGVCAREELAGLEVVR